MSDENGDFASLHLNDAMILCVGGMTHAEADALRGDDPAFDGRGYYLFLADERAPDQPIQVLAKFLSAFEAERLARLFSRRNSLAAA